MSEIYSLCMYVCVRVTHNIWTHYHYRSIHSTLILHYQMHSSVYTIQYTFRKCFPSRIAIVRRIRWGQVLKNKYKLRNLKFLSRSGARSHCDTNGTKSMRFSSKPKFISWFVYPVSDTVLFNIRNVYGTWKSMRKKLKRN